MPFHAMPCHAIPYFALRTPHAQDLLRLIDLCPFLASEKSRYDDDAVRSLLTRNPRAACLRHSYRCGIGNNAANNGAYPLALVVALGGSVEVVGRMVDACPAALGKKLSGRRNVLHYAIAEGVGVDVVRYLTSRNPSLVTEEDSFQALPLHLACTYSPSSSPSVLLHLLGLHPGAAKSLDHKSQTPLHRACGSRASMEKVLALVEAYPDALFLNDWLGTRPLEYAESMHQRLSEPMPEVIEVLGMAEDILRTDDGDGNRGAAARPPLSSAVSVEDDSDAAVAVGGGVEADRAGSILAHFRTIGWRGGMRLAFARNANLASVLDLPPGVFPRLLRLLGTEGAYSVLVRRPDVVCGFASRR
jgi:hypothetical protein